MRLDTESLCWFILGVSTASLCYEMAFYSRLTKIIEKHFPSEDKKK